MDNGLYGQNQSTNQSHQLPNMDNCWVIVGQLLGNCWVIDSVTVGRVNKKEPAAPAGEKVAR